MIITISHQKGGVGKSTILWNLIAEYSKRNKITVVDLDAQKTITYTLQIRKKLGINIRNITLLDPKDEKDLIKIIKEYQKKGLVLIDSGGFDSKMNRIAIAGSNLLLTPVSSKFYELLGLKKYEEVLSFMSTKLNKKIIANVVLNKINPNVRDLSEIINFINHSKHFHLMKSVMRQRVDYENSPGVGKSVVEFNKEGRASQEFIAFKKELSKIILS